VKEEAGTSTPISAFIKAADGQLTVAASAGTMNYQPHLLSKIAL